MIQYIDSMCAFYVNFRMFKMILIGIPPLFTSKPTITNNDIHQEVLEGNLKPLVLLISTTPWNINFKIPCGNLRHLSDVLKTCPDDALLQQTFDCMCVHWEHIMVSEHLQVVINVHVCSLTLASKILLGTFNALIIGNTKLQLVWNDVQLCLCWEHSVTKRSRERWGELREEKKRSVGGINWHLGKDEW